MITKMMMLIEIDDSDDRTCQKSNNVDQDEVGGEGEGEPDENPFEQLSWQASLRQLPLFHHGETFHVSGH